MRTCVPCTVITSIAEPPVWHLCLLSYSVPVAQMQDEPLAISPNVHCAYVFHSASKVRNAMRADVPVRGVAQDLLQVRFAAPAPYPGFGPAG